MENLNDTIKELGAVRGIAKERTAIDVDNAIVEKATLYVRSAVGGKSGTQSMIKPSDSEADGVRNIDNAKLPTGEAFLVTGIAISSGTHRGAMTNESSLSTVAFQNGTEEGIESIFFNSELSIKAGRKEKFKSLLRHIMPINAGDDTFEKNAHSVTPFVIESQQLIEINLEIYDAIDATTDDSAVEVALIGFRITANNA